MLCPVDFDRRGSKVEGDVDASRNKLFRMRQSGRGGHDVEAPRFKLIFTPQMVRVEYNVDASQNEPFPMQQSEQVEGDVKDSPFKVFWDMADRFPAYNGVGIVVVMSKMSLLCQLPTTFESVAQPFIWRSFYLTHKQSAQTNSRMLFHGSDGLHIC